MAKTLLGAWLGTIFGEDGNEMGDNASRITPFFKPLVGFGFVVKNWICKIDGHCRHPVDALEYDLRSLLCKEYNWE